MQHCVSHHLQKKMCLGQKKKSCMFPVTWVKFSLGEVGFFFFFLFFFFLVWEGTIKRQKFRFFFQRQEKIPFFFSTRKKSLGSGSKIRVGRVTGNIQLFFLALSIFVCFWQTESYQWSTPQNSGHTGYTVQLISFNLIHKHHDGFLNDDKKFNDYIMSCFVLST